jgi:hypothetical protein
MGGWHALSLSLSGYRIRLAVFQQSSCRCWYGSGGGGGALIHSFQHHGPCPRHDVLRRASAKPLQPQTWPLPPARVSQIRSGGSPIHLLFIYLWIHLFLFIYLLFVR